MSELDYQAIHERDENDEVTQIGWINQKLLDIQFHDHKIKIILKNMEIFLCEERSPIVQKAQVARLFRILDEGRFDMLIAQKRKIIDPNNEFLE